MNTIPDWLFDSRRDDRKKGTFRPHYKNSTQRRDFTQDDNNISCPTNMDHYDPLEDEQPDIPSPNLHTVLSNNNDNSSAYTQSLSNSPCNPNYSSNRTRKIPVRETSDTSSQLIDNSNSSITRKKPSTTRRKNEYFDTSSDEEEDSLFANGRIFDLIRGNEKSSLSTKSAPNNTTESQGNISSPGFQFMSFQQLENRFYATIYERYCAEIKESINTAPSTSSQKVIPIEKMIGVGSPLYDNKRKTTVYMGDDSSCYVRAFVMKKSEKSITNSLSSSILYEFWLLDAFIYENNPDVQTIENLYQSTPTSITNHDHDRVAVNQLKLTVWDNQMTREQYDSIQVYDMIEITSFKMDAHWQITKSLYVGSEEGIDTFPGTTLSSSILQGEKDNSDVSFHISPWRLNYFGRTCSTESSFQLGLIRNSWIRVVKPFISKKKLGNISQGKVAPKGSLSHKCAHSSFEEVSRFFRKMNITLYQQKTNGNVVQSFEEMLLLVQHELSKVVTLVDVLERYQVKIVQENSSRLVQNKSTHMVSTMMKRIRRIRMEAAEIIQCVRTNLNNLTCCLCGMVSHIGTVEEPSPGKKNHKRTLMLLDGRGNSLSCMILGSLAKLLSCVKGDTLFFPKVKIFFEGSNDLDNMLKICMNTLGGGNTGVIVQNTEIGNDSSMLLVQYENIVKSLRTLIQNSPLLSRVYQEKVMYRGKGKTPKHCFMNTSSASTKHQYQSLSVLDIHQSVLFDQYFSCHIHVMCFDAPENQPIILFPSMPHRVYNIDILRKEKNNLSVVDSFDSVCERKQSELFIKEENSTCYPSQSLSRNYSNAEPSDVIQKQETIGSIYRGFFLSTENYEKRLSLLFPYQFLVTSMHAKEKTMFDDSDSDSDMYFSDDIDNGDDTEAYKKKGHKIQRQQQLRQLQESPVDLPLNYESVFNEWKEYILTGRERRNLVKSKLLNDSSNFHGDDDDDDDEYLTQTQFLVDHYEKFIYVEDIRQALYFLLVWKKSYWDQGKEELRNLSLVTKSSSRSQVEFISSLQEYEIKKGDQRDLLQEEYYQRHLPDDSFMSSTNIPVGTTTSSHDAKSKTRFKSRHQYEMMGRIVGLFSLASNDRHFSHSGNNIQSDTNVCNDSMFIRRLLQEFMSMFSSSELSSSMNQSTNHPSNVHKALEHMMSHNGTSSNHKLFYFDEEDDDDVSDDLACFFPSIVQTYCSHPNCFYRTKFDPHKHGWVCESPSEGEYSKNQSFQQGTVSPHIQEYPCFKYSLKVLLEDSHGYQYPFIVSSKAAEKIMGITANEWLYSNWITRLCSISRISLLFDRKVTQAIWLLSSCSYMKNESTQDNSNSSNTDQKSKRGDNNRIFRKNPNIVLPVMSLLCEFQKRHYKQYTGVHNVNGTTSLHQHSNSIDDKSLYQCTLPHIIFEKTSPSIMISLESTNTISTKKNSHTDNYRDRCAPFTPNSTTDKFSYDSKRNATSCSVKTFETITDIYMIPSLHDSTQTNNSSDIIHQEKVDKIYHQPETIHSVTHMDTVVDGVHTFDVWNVFHPRLYSDLYTLNHTATVRAPCNPRKYSLSSNTNVNAIKENTECFSFSTESFHSSISSPKTKRGKKQK